jgi:hypothetical protein
LLLLPDVFGHQQEILSASRMVCIRAHTGNKKEAVGLDQEDSAELMNAKAISKFQDRVQSERKGIGTIKFGVKPLDSDCQFKGATG